MRKLKLPWRPQTHPPVATANANQPFDLAKIQYETSYRAKRRTALKRTAWGAGALLLIAWWFLQPSLLTGRAIGNYNHQHYTQARDWLTPLTWTSPQQFVIAFNSGTVDTKLQHYDTAQRELYRALALASASQRCMVLQNLVYSLNAHAGSLINQNDNHDANVYSTQANTYVSDNPKCFQGGNKGKQNGSGGGGGGGGSSTAQQQSNSPSSAQQQQLQQKEAQGEQLQQQDINQDTFNPNDPHLRQW